MYARDEATGATIEQVIECTAPTDAPDEQLRQFVADTTSRFPHSINSLETIASGERDHVTDTTLLRTSDLQLGGTA